MAGDQIILDEVFRRASITMEPQESPEEHASRILNERRQATFEMVRSYVLFFVILLAIITVGALCIYEGFFDASAPNDTKRWAQTTLTALFTGSITFVLGQMSAKKRGH
jgi:hypothetical protein